MQGAIAIAMNKKCQVHDDDPGKAGRVVGVRYRRKTKGAVVTGTWTAKGWRCEHGRERSRCKECGGASICEHGRVRSQCKECGGASICQHGRVRSQCKECGGSSLCKDCHKKCPSFGFAGGGAGTQRVQPRWCSGCAAKHNRHGATSNHRLKATERAVRAATEQAVAVDLTATGDPRSLPSPPPAAEALPDVDHKPSSQSSTNHAPPVCRQTSLQKREPRPVASHHEHCQQLRLEAEERATIPSHASLRSLRCAITYGFAHVRGPGPLMILKFTSHKIE